MTVYVGTSGWQYESWKGRFYPHGLVKARWLEYFSQRFATVEVNNTFYRLPDAETFRRWRRESAAGHVMAVKGSRYLTHVRRLREPADSLRLFWSRARNLGAKLGPVLWQLPPDFPADVARLRVFLERFPRGMRAALEFRHASWDTDEVRELLDEAGAALVLADRPGARVRDVVTGGWAYLRLHQGRRAAPGYPRPKLGRWADRIAALPAPDVFVYFNNDADGAAVRDAATLTDLLEERGVEVARPRAGRATG